jgi:glutathione synthase/RimK-type ligase-like ATP-grasp enzyme
METPDTLWTNSRAAAARALGHRGVVKSVATAYWEDDGSYFVFADRMSADELPDQENVSHQPIAIQEEISPKRDVRITVVGDRVFAAELPRPSETLDWRREDPQQWREHVLPARVAEQAKALISRFGLRFGAIDVALTDARYVFIELNPNGEWGWLQKAGLPIAAAIADELTRSRS